MRPVLVDPSATVVNCLLSHVAEAVKCFGRHMAKIIEFYIPQSFCKVSKWVPTTERGKLLAFPLVQNDNRRDLF